jgi:hypothetical protein
MAFNLFSYIKSLLPRLRKDDILEDLRVTKGSFETLRGVYDGVLSKLSDYKWNSKQNEALSKIFYRNYKSSLGKATNIPVDFAKTIPVLLANLAIVDRELDQILGADVLNEGLSAKKAILIRACEHFSFIARYSLDLINYILCAETLAEGQTIDQAISPATVQYIESNILNFAVILSAYTRPTDVFSNSINEIPDLIISSNNVGAVSGVYSDAKLDPFQVLTTHGFSASPIYRVRLVIAEWQATHYKSIKDKKQMLELRLLRLKMKEDGTEDPGLEKQIQYLQDRIDGYEHKLAEMER